MSTQTASTGASPRMISLGFDEGLHPAGTHMCLIFNDDAERRGVMARFLQSGLEGNEMVCYVVDTQTPEELKQSMRTAGVALPEELDGRQYAVVHGSEHYCSDGTFKVDHMLYDMLSVHPMMIVHGQVLRNPYYVDPEVFLAARYARSGV